MTSHNRRLLSIDEAYLLRRYPELARLIRQGYDPDEVGQAWLNRAAQNASRQQFQRKASAEEEWDQAKDVIHQVLHTDNPEFHVVRGLLFARPGITTPVLVSTLSLWLAGHLGLSLSIVTPLVAVILYEIAAEEEGSLKVVS